MKFKKFIIKNFKGINELEIDLEKRPAGKIFPLVGLNESGKTTILEAINLLQNQITDKEEIKKLRHKDEVADFKKKIIVEATLELENFDEKIIEDYFKNKNLQFKKLSKEINFYVEYDFSKDIDTENILTINFKNIPVKIKQKQSKKYQAYNFLENDKKLRNQLQKNIPKILYFKNFFFDFPKKIYLESVDNASEITNSSQQKEYRKILQDILDSLDEKYSVTTHVLDRIKNKKDDDALDKILNEMSQKLNNTIITPWRQVFSNSRKMEIEIKLENDENKYFLKFSIKEETNSFNIEDRSLGFRWFFSFLIFTEFRKAREEEKSEYLFLFDEPASNLHQKNQQTLLSLFENLTNKSKIIYSTHSHYLLNPKFLLNTLIVKDEGIKENNMDNNAQDIKATPYKTFVGNSPNDTTHFKPILDILEYIENPFENTDKIVFVEGKNDYYTFKWFLNTIFKDENFDFKFYPGGGVTKYENVFREYLAHNRKFIAVFDGDKEGEKAKKNYIETISKELEKKIFTLKDIDENFNQFTTEKLFTNEDQLKIQKKSDSKDTNFNKKKFNGEIQELFIKEELFELSNETKENFKTIFEFIKNKLKNTDQN